MDGLGEKQLASLTSIDQKVAHLLEVAGSTVSSLAPPGQADKDKENEDDMEQDTPSFEESSTDFFKTLNEIQVGLRTSILALEASRTSVRPLTDPTYFIQKEEGLTSNDTATSNTNTAPAPGEKASVQLSLGAQRLEAQAWQQLKHDLEQITKHNTTNDVTQQ